MKTFRKALVVFAAVLILLFGSASLWLTVFFQPGDYRDVFSDYVYRQTGRALTVNGEVRVSFGWKQDGGPRVHVAAGGVEVFNRRYLTERPTATADWMEAEIRLLPLLYGSWSVARVVLERPQVNLFRFEDGRSNWEDLALLGLAPVDDLHGYGGQLTWIDQVAEQTITLTGISWRVRYDPGNDTADIELTFRTPASLAGRPLSIRLDTQMSRSPEAGTTVPFGRLAAHVAGPNMLATMELQGGTIDFSTERLAAARSQFTLAVPGVEAKFQSNSLEYGSNPGTVQLTGISGEGYFGRVAPNFTAASARLDLARGAFEIPVLTTRWLGHQAVAGLEGHSLYGEPRVQGHVSVSEVNLADVLHWADIERGQRTGHPQVLVSASARFKADAQVVSINELDLSMGEQQVRGWMQLNFESEPVWSFDFRTDQLDLPPTRVLLTPGGSPVALLIGLPLRFSGTGRTTGSLAIGQLRAGGLLAEDIKARIKGAGRQLAVSPLTAKFYGGETRADLVLDYRQPEPVLRLQGVLSGFDPGGVVRDLTAIDMMSGQADLSVDLAVTQPAAPDAVERAVGVAEFELENAGVRGAVLDSLSRLLGGIDVEFPDVIAVVPGSSATVVIDKGVARNTDLRVSGSGLRIDGRGEVTLKNQSIDYRLTIGLEPEETDDIAQAVVRFLPLRLSGTLASLRLSIDVPELIRLKIEAELKGGSPPVTEPAQDSRTSRYQQRLRVQMRKALQDLDP